jgi:hypothetical protein
MSYAILKGQSAAEYHKSPRVSNSMLGMLHAKSEAHLRHYLDNPRSSETPAKAFGSAFHSLVLTPKLFHRDYFRRPEKGYAKSHAAADRKAYEYAVSQNPGKTAIAYGDWPELMAIAANLLDRPKVNNLIGPIPEYWREVSLYWNDPSGIECKARIDAYSEAHDAIIDLKTTKDASPAAFARSIMNYGYARQAAFYQRAAKACGLDPKHFVFIAVEKEPPYAVGLYRITDSSIKQQNVVIDRLLERYQRAVATNSWPDYGSEVSDIDVSKNSFTEEIEND